MKPNEAIKLLKRCDAADRHWRIAAKEWSKRGDDCPEHAHHRAHAERITRELSPEIKIDYPGLYPAFTACQKPYYSLSSALIEMLPEKSARVVAAWRMLRDRMRRGMTVSIIHAGDRSRVRFVVPVKREDTGKLVTVDLTWHMGRAFGYRYSERARLLSVQDPVSLVGWLARELFGAEDALKADWL